MSKEITATMRKLWKLMKAEIERSTEVDVELFIELTIDLYNSGDLD